MSHPETPRLSLQGALFRTAREELARRGDRDAPPPFAPPPQSETDSQLALVSLFEQRLAGLPTERVRSLHLELCHAFLQELDLQLGRGRLYDRG